MIFMQRTSCDKKCDYEVLSSKIVKWENFCGSDRCKVLYELFGDPRLRWRSKIRQGRQMTINYLFEQRALPVVEIACLGSVLFLHTLYYNS